MKELEVGLVPADTKSGGATTSSSSVVASLRVLPREVVVQRRTVYLIRHGESRWNAAQHKFLKFWRVPGFRDAPLSGTGRDQCERLAANLRVSGLLEKLEVLGGTGGGEDGRGGSAAERGPPPLEKVGQTEGGSPGEDTASLSAVGAVVAPAEDRGPIVDHSAAHDPEEQTAPAGETGGTGEEPEDKPDNPETSDEGGTSSPEATEEASAAQPQLPPAPRFVILCSPLTRAVETCLIGLQDHVLPPDPYTPGQLITLIPSCREKRASLFAMDAAGCAVGDDIPDRILAQLELVYDRKSALQRLAEAAGGLRQAAGTGRGSVGRGRGSVAVARDDDAPRVVREFRSIKFELAEVLNGVWWTANGRICPFGGRFGYGESNELKGGGAEKIHGHTVRGED